MAAGDFLASKFPEILLREEAIWKGNDQSLTPNTVTASSIANNQTADISDILGTTKRDNTLRVWFPQMDAALDGTKACIAECSPTGTELEAASETYSLVCVQANNITIKDGAGLRTNAYGKEEQIARATAKQKKEIKEKINQEAILNLSVKHGLNAVPVGALDNVDTDKAGLSPNKTFILDANWNADRFASFEVIAKVNHFSNYRMIHGFNFLPEFRNYELMALNQNQKDNIAAMNLFKHTSDPLGFIDPALAKSSFLINNDSIAFGSKHYNESLTPQYVGGDKYKWFSADNDLRFASPNEFTGGLIKGLFFDHTMTVSCVDGAGLSDTETQIVMETRAYYGFFNARVFGNQNTGIIEVVKGARA